MSNSNSGRGVVDNGQVLPAAYDTVEEAIRVLPAGGSGFSIELSAADGDSVDVRDITGAISLPTGASTSAKQDTGNTSLSSIDTKLSSQATAAKQDTGNTSLASVDGKLASLGQKVMTGSVPVVIASDQSAITIAPQVIDTTTLLNAVDAGVSVDSSGVNILLYERYSIMLIWASLDAADGVVKVQVGNDNSNWYDLPGETKTLNTALGTHLFNENDAQYKYFRLDYDHGTNSTGTLTAQYIVKG